MNLLVKWSASSHLRSKDNGSRASLLHSESTWRTWWYCFTSNYNCIYLHSQLWFALALYVISTLPHDQLTTHNKHMGSPTSESLNTCQHITKASIWPTTYCIIAKLNPLTARWLPATENTQTPVCEGRSGYETTSTGTGGSGSSGSSGSGSSGSNFHQMRSACSPPTATYLLQS